MKKALLILFTAINLVFACDTPPIEYCYHCRLYVTKDYCDHQEIYVLEDGYKCDDWSEADIKAYEAKTTYTMDEKCFYLVQISKCEKEQI